jgi:hypothetical protein
MTPNAIASHLFTVYEQYRLNFLNAGNCRHDIIHQELRSLVEKSDGLLSLRDLGTSTEGRAIRLVSAGRGEKRILLWSQMHGDESTATLALMDLFNYLVETGGEESWASEMLDQTTIMAIPMINPDGAERIQRQTALGIDMNRDARLLITPEAKILREAQRSLRPAFGFNLHDQGLWSVGTTTKAAAIALLAPAMDERRSTPMGRLRAMRVGATIARALSQFAGGHLATYDDTYEPRAFGDGMQAWGTSTILIESGHWPGDPQKAFIRKLNFIALLIAFRAIGNGSYQDSELDWYKQLRENGTRVFDLIIRGVELHDRVSAWSGRVDIGMMYSPPHHQRPHDSPPTVVIKEIGDLGFHVGLEEIDASKRRLIAGRFALEKEIALKEIMDVLQLVPPR